MAKLVKQGKSQYPLIELARRSVQGLPQKDVAGEAAIIHAYVRDFIRYVRDPRGLETVQSPSATLQIGQGDCDDKSVLAATLLECLGIRCRFVAVSLDTMPELFVHVFPEALINGRWFAVETTEPVPLGWRPVSVAERMEQNIP